MGPERTGMDQRNPDSFYLLCTIQNVSHPTRARVFRIKGAPYLGRQNSFIRSRSRRDSIAIGMTFTSRGKYVIPEIEAIHVVMEHNILSNEPIIDGGGEDLDEEP